MQHLRSHGAVQHAVRIAINVLTKFDFFDILYFVPLAGSLCDVIMNPLVSARASSSNGGWYFLLQRWHLRN